MVHSFEALGTKWWITLLEEPKAADVIKDDIGRLVSDYEARYSRFKPDSLISTLNRERVLRNPDTNCRALLQYGKQLYLRTNGVFNMLTGHILEARGYDINYSFTDTGSEALTPGNPITDLLISDDKIELTHGNVDLGGFGKGYLIDLLAKRLQSEHNQHYFLINGGGDMYATSNHDKPIEIFLEHPTKLGTGIAKASLKNQGFAASSPYRRQWKTSEGDTHHIVGAVTTDALFVKAATAADADAFATSLLQLSKQEQEKIASQEQLGLARYAINQNNLLSNKLFGQ